MLSQTWSLFIFLSVLLASCSLGSNKTSPPPGPPVFRHLSSYSEIVTHATSSDSRKTKVFIYEKESCSLLEEWFTSQWEYFESSLKVFIVDCLAKEQRGPNNTSNVVRGNYSPLLLQPCLSTEESNSFHNFSAVMPFSKKYENLFDFPIENNVVFGKKGFDVTDYAMNVEFTIPLVSKIFENLAPFHLFEEENNSLKIRKDLIVEDGVYFTAKSEILVPPSFKALSLEFFDSWNVVFFLLFKVKPGYL